MRPDRRHRGSSRLCEGRPTVRVRRGSNGCAALSGVAAAPAQRPRLGLRSDGPVHRQEQRATVSWLGADASPRLEEQDDARACEARLASGLIRSSDQSRPSTPHGRLDRFHLVEAGLRFVDGDRPEEIRQAFVSQLRAGTFCSTEIGPFSSKNGSRRYGNRTHSSVCRALMSTETVPLAIGEVRSVNEYRNRTSYRGCHLLVLQSLCVVQIRPTVVVKKMIREDSRGFPN